MKRLRRLVRMPRFWVVIASTIVLHGVARAFLAPEWASVAANLAGVWLALLVLAPDTDDEPE